MLIVRLMGSFVIGRGREREIQRSMSSFHVILPRVYS